MICFVTQVGLLLFLVICWPFNSRTTASKLSGAAKDPVLRGLCAKPCYFICIVVPALVQTFRRSDQHFHLEDEIHHSI